MSTSLIAAAAAHPLAAAAAHPIAAAAAHPFAAAAAEAKKPFIDWAALGKVAGVSFVFGIAVVVLFSIGIVGASWMQGRGEPASEASGLAGIDAGAQSGAVRANRTLGAALAGMCFALCGAAVLFGLWLIIPQFH